MILSPLALPCVVCMLASVVCPPLPNEVVCCLALLFVGLLLCLLSLVLLLISFLEKIKKERLKSSIV